MVDTWLVSCFHKPRPHYVSSSHRDLRHTDMALRSGAVWTQAPRVTLAHVTGEPLQAISTVYGTLITGTSPSWNSAPPTQHSVSPHCLLLFLPAPSQPFSQHSLCLSCHLHPQFLIHRYNPQQKEDIFKCLNMCKGFFSLQETRATSAPLEFMTVW